MKLMLKNSDGKPSSSFTMMIIGFVVVTLWLVVSITTKISHFEIRPFDGTAAMSYLSPLLALYGVRRSQAGNPAATPAAPTDSPNTTA